MGLNQNFTVLFNPNFNDKFVSGCPLIFQDKISRKYQDIKTTFAILRQYQEYQDIFHMFHSFHTIL